MFGRRIALLLCVGLTSLLGACQTLPQGPNSLIPDSVYAKANAPLPPSSTPMPQGVLQRDPPPGFISFCMRFADQCSSDANEASVIAISSNTWSKLKVINTKVNAAIWPEDDQRHFDRAEYWTISTDGYGNCHDYAVTKRKMLADAGIPLRALRVAVVVTPRNNRHAVLTVATDQGDYVLDNLTDDIVPWSTTGYQWISRQDSRNDWGWVALNGQPVQMASTATGEVGR